MITAWLRIPKPTSKKIANRSRATWQIIQQAATYTTLITPKPYRVTRRSGPRTGRYSPDDPLLT